MLDELNTGARRHDGLVFGPKPATHDHCTHRRDDRQQLLRRDRAADRHDRRQCRRLEVLLYDGTRMWVGPTSDEEYARDRRGRGGRRAEIYQALRALARPLRRPRSAVATRDIPRRVSGYNLPDLLPENGFHVARALVGTRVDLRDGPARRARPACPSRRRAALVLLGYPDIAAAADARAAVDAAPARRRSRARRQAHRLRARTRMNPAALHLLPRRRRLADGPVRRRRPTTTPTRRRRRAARRARARRRRPSTSSSTTPRTKRSSGRVRESALGATARVPGDADTWPGWEDSAVPPDRLGDYLRDLQTLLDEFGYRRRLALRPLRPGLRAHQHPVRPDHRGRHRPLPVVRRARRRPRAIVRRIAVRRARRRAGPRRAADQDVRRRAGRARSSEFKAIFDPDDRMNPGKVVRRQPARRAPAPRRRLAAAAEPRDAVRASRTTTAASPGRADALRRRRRVPAARQRAG